MSAPKPLRRPDPYLTADGRPDFEALFREARPRLLAVARRLMRSEADAEDIVQQAFVSGLLHKDAFEARAQVTSWMHRITYNAALMALRSKGRRSVRSLEELPGEDRIIPAEEQGALDDPEEAAARSCMREVLDEALATLSPLDRSIVDLRLREERSTEETAEAVGLSSSAAKARLHRARQALQAALREEVTFAP